MCGLVEVVQDECHGVRAVTWLQAVDENTRPGVCSLLAEEPFTRRAVLWLGLRPPRRACFVRVHYLHRLGADAAQRVLCHARLVVCFANHATSACRCEFLL